MPKLSFKIVEYDRGGIETYTDKNPVPRVQFLDEQDAKIVLMGSVIDNQGRQVRKDGQFKESIGGDVAHIQQMKQELIRRFEMWLSSRGKVVELNEIYGEEVEVNWPDGKQ